MQTIYNRLQIGFIGPKLKAVSSLLLLTGAAFLAQAENLSRQATSTEHSTGQDRPNVIVIVTDDHGYADFGAYNLSKDIRTPHLDKMANGGALVTQGYSTAPQCVPSRAGIATAKYQTRFGLEDNDYRPMDIKEITVAQRMRDAGYAIGFVGKWHLDPNRNSRDWMTTHWPEGLKQKRPIIPTKLGEPYLPMSRGYTDYYDGAMHAYLRNYDLNGKSIESKRIIDRETFRVDKQTAAALAFINRHPKEPFFSSSELLCPPCSGRGGKKAL